MIYTNFNTTYEIIAYIMSFCLFMFLWCAVRDEYKTKRYWLWLWLLPVVVILGPIILPFIAVCALLILFSL